MPRLKPKDWPACLQGHKLLKGVFVGGCVSRGDGSRFRAKAHAHTGGPHVGWICVLSAKRLEDRELMLHELAHVLTGEGHTDRWRKRLLELGGSLYSTASLRSYEKKPRPKTTWWCGQCGEACVGQAALNKHWELFHPRERKPA